MTTAELDALEALREAWDNSPTGSVEALAAVGPAYARALTEAAPFLIAQARRAARLEEALGLAAAEIGCLSRELWELDARGVHVACLPSDEVDAAIKSALAQEGGE